MDEYRISRVWRDQRLVRVGAGTTETMRYYIAKLLGF
jgi:citronellyl-CoA dehydrogenase